MLTVCDDGLDLSAAEAGDEFYIIHENRETHVPYSISRYVVEKVGKRDVCCFWMASQPSVRFNKHHRIRTGVLPGSDRVDEVILILRQQEACATPTGYAPF